MRPGGWLCTAVVVALMSLGACSPTVAPSPHPSVQGRHRTPCASEGFSCKPGPCCRGLKCEDDVCRKPSKD